MELSMLLIDRNKKILGGKPIIKGTRISVDLITSYLVNGYDIQDIKRDYPFLTNEQIQEAIEYADRSIHNKKVDLETSST
jgi:uncharacterized protein (DUF433 family)